MADTGDQLLREIDEDLKREQWIRLWKSYGRYLAALVAIVLLVVLGYVGWNEYRESQLGEDGYIYWQADQADLLGDGQRASALFASLAEDGHAGYRLLGALRHAQELAQAGDTQAAVAVYDRIADDGGFARAYRQLADLYAAILLLDGDDAAAVEQRLDGLGNGTWRHSAREIEGLLALKTGDRARAATIFSELASDESAPTTLRNRAAELATLASDGDA